MSAFPTGNELVDTNVLLQLSDQDLSRTCRSSAYLNSLCSNDYFWKLKLAKHHPQFIPLGNKFPSYRKIYQWIQNQVYVFDAGYPYPSLFNDINKAYDTMILYTGYDYDNDVPMEDPPPIEKTEELAKIIQSLPPGHRTYLYALPKGEKILGADPEHILFKLPDYVDKNGILSPLLPLMPTLKPDLFLIYSLPRKHREQRDVIIKRFSPQSMEKAYNLSQGVYANWPGASDQQSLYFAIERSDTQGIRSFSPRVNFFQSEGFPHLAIMKNNAGDFVLAELPPYFRDDIITPEIYDTLDWKPLESIIEYL